MLRLVQEPKHVWGSRNLNGQMFNDSQADFWQWKVAGFMAGKVR
jgi:hypothetical protein